MTVEAVIDKLRQKVQFLEAERRNDPQYTGLINFLNECADELAAAIAPKDLSSIQNGRCVAHFEPNQVKGLKLRVELQVCFSGGNWQDEKWIYFWDGLRYEFDDEEILRICEDAAHKHYKQHKVEYVDLKAVGLYWEPYFLDTGEEVEYAGEECPKCDSTESAYVSFAEEEEYSEEAMRCTNCGAIFVKCEDDTVCQIA